MGTNYGQVLAAMLEPTLTSSDILQETESRTAVLMYEKHFVVGGPT